VDVTEAQQAVGQALARLREAANLDPVTFCELAGYHAETLANIELGKYNSITVRVLCTYAEASGIPIEDMIGGIVKPFDELTELLKGKSRTRRVKK
jgi:transcriptional regulator with XRE-family HTH domain